MTLPPARRPRPHGGQRRAPVGDERRLPGTKGDGMRIAIIDDGIDISRPSFSGAGYSTRRASPRASPPRRTASHRGPRLPAARAAGRATRTAFDPGRRSTGPTWPASPPGTRASRGQCDGVRVPGLSGVAPRAYLGNYRVLTVPTPAIRSRRQRRGDRPGHRPGRRRTGWTCSTSRSASRGHGRQDLVEHAIAGAARAGVLTVAAAGNEGDEGGNGTIDSPAAAPDAIATAAVTNDRFFGVPMRVLGPGAGAGEPGGVRRRGRRQHHPADLRGGAVHGRGDGLRKRGPRRRARPRAPDRLVQRGAGRRAGPPGTRLRVLVGRAGRPPAAGRPGHAARGPGRGPRWPGS